MPTTEPAISWWTFRPGWLSEPGSFKVKGSQPDAEILRWVAACAEYLKHDPEADLSRPLCFRVHGGRACRRLEGHDV